MTSKLTRLTDDELTETLRQATSGYPLPASVEGNLRHAFAELQERRKADSEPVALQPELAKVIYHFRDWNEGFPVERFKADYVISWMLANYPPAQPAPVVPELRVDWQENEFSAGWNACRAAMLQELKKSAGAGAVCRSNENMQVLHTKSPAQSDCCPAQNSVTPVQNKGWIPVSERMPGSQEWVIVFAKWANQQVLCWDDVQNRWTDFEDQSYYADMFSHWMPLPAAPQEVLDGK
ncbi:DUF551 domain-containing protein [Klebsiella grimontii]|uniref:DUF551 domain-containing protein n=1 Tax=Klebsiella grimontii TaxID=2058152 RepID=UPI0012B6E18A|nr:DUF551 domain-containing protein [Klebsiella grimontii]